MLKKFLLFIFFTTTVFAYSSGDNIDSKVVSELKLEKGKVYIVDFFASWCKSCKIELPLVSNMVETLDKNYEVIGVNIDEEKEDGESFVKKLDLKFRIVYDNSKTLVSKFAPIGVPAIYYIKDNKILKAVYGAVHNIDEKIKKDIYSFGE